MLTTFVVHLLVGCRLLDVGCRLCGQTFASQVNEGRGLLGLKVQQQQQQPLNLHN